MAPCFSGSSKRCVAMVVYDPAAAERRAAKRVRQEEASASSSSSSTRAGEMVPHAEPIDAVPVSAAPPRAPPPPAIREMPPCLRRHFLPALGLRADLPVHFIDEKLVSSTDLDPHQNRFRIPRNGVERRLRPILTPAELDAANLLHDPPAMPRPKKRPHPEPEAAGQHHGDEGEQQGKKAKRPKKRGRVHGGLPVALVNLTAGARNLQMSRWESSKGTIVKGEGYLDFIRRCGLREGDAVEVWAFVQRRIKLFGVNVYDESVLHVLIVKKHEPAQYRYCAIPHEQ